MAKDVVLYYFSYGHIETMARTVAEGAARTGATVDIKRVPETAPASKAGRSPRRPTSCLGNSPRPRDVLPGNGRAMRPFFLASTQAAAVNRENCRNLKP